jgi:hypothetical protein
VHEQVEHGFFPFCESLWRDGIAFKKLREAASCHEVEGGHSEDGENGVAGVELAEFARSGSGFDRFVERILKGTEEIALNPLQAAARVHGLALNQAGVIGMSREEIHISEEQIFEATMRSRFGICQFVE